MDLVHLGLESAVYVSKIAFNNHNIQLYQLTLRFFLQL